MSEYAGHKGSFDIPDVPNFIPRGLKPWLFILFVLIIQFSGGIYMAAASDMVGTTALMQQDILMSGYAMLAGMSINFAVMFRLKFRFSNRIGLLICGTVLILANIICATTDSVPILVLTCFIAGWFRMWATFVCNSTIQLWLTPVRDMAIFFCYVYLVVDGVIQLSGICTVYTSFLQQWEYMHWIMIALLALMMLLVLILVRPVKGPLQIPLLGIDWIGAILWAGFMLCFIFVCVYGDYYDWWSSEEIIAATLIGIGCVTVNLWRATFLHHPYISFAALKNKNVIRATLVYLVFFTLLSTEHVLEHTYIQTVLGFDETNLIDLNWYVIAGIIAGCAFTYFTFALHKWTYRSITCIAFTLAAIYLGWFYFMLDYGVEKQALFLPLFIRGAASVIISIVYLTSILQGGLHFFVFPQALTVNGFTGAIMGATLGPAIIGEIFQHVMAKNFASLSAALTLTDNIPQNEIGQLYGMLQIQSAAISMKEIYGYLLIAALISVAILIVVGKDVRPHAILPKWRTIRRALCHSMKILRLPGLSSKKIRSKILPE